MFFPNLKQSNPTPSTSTFESKLAEFPIIKWSSGKELQTSDERADAEKQDLYLLRVDLDSDASSMQIVNKNDDICAKISAIRADATLSVRSKYTWVYLCQFISSP